MRQLLITLVLLLAFSVCGPSASAQKKATTTKQTATKPKTQTATKPKTQTATKPKSQTATKTKAQTASKPKSQSASQSKSSSKTKQKTTTKTQQKGKTKGKTTQKQKADYKTAEIKGLEKERSKVQNTISTKERELKENKADVKVRLQNLLDLNTEIDQRQKSIDTIQHDIKTIDGNIGILSSQLATLQGQLAERRTKFIESMRYMARYRSIQDKLLFIFSAGSIPQMYRRMRFVREYASYQRAQGELLKSKQQQVNEKSEQLKLERGNKNTLLYKDRQAHAALQNKQEEQQQMVASLQAEQHAIEGILAEQRKHRAELDAKIDQLIAVEIEKARARAAAEEKRRAAAEAEAKKRRAEEAARKKAAAEAERRENERRVAAAREREEKAKAEARAAAAAADKRRREEADRKAREAEEARLAAERKAEAENRRAEREVAKAEREVEEAPVRMTTADRHASGSFENHRGSLPMPLSGRIVSHYGQYNVEGLSGVTLSNNGINIKGSAGAPVRSVFAGEVSAVFGFQGTTVVMIRHGAYISVYCNLKSVSVSVGQRVSGSQTIGSVGSDGILQFQLRKETAKLNPEAWLRR